MFKKSLVLVFILCWIVLGIAPVDRDIWMLENVVVVGIFPWRSGLIKISFYKRFFFSLTLFVILHLFGAHLTYEKMTYFTWFSEWFGWQRNYYDQVIHFLFGLMLFMPFFEIFYHQGHSRKLSYLIAFLFISSISSWYEVLEWLAMVSFCTAAELDCLRLITQGDVWDTQKDMAYAIVGACITILLHRQWGYRASLPGERLQV